MKLSMMRLGITTTYNVEPFLILTYLSQLIRKARVNVYLYIVCTRSPKTIILSNNHGINAKLF